MERKRPVIYDGDDFAKNWIYVEKRPTLSSDGKNHAYSKNLRRC